MAYAVDMEGKVRAPSRSTPKVKKPTLPKTPTYKQLSTPTTQKAPTKTYVAPKTYDSKIDYTNEMARELSSPNPDLKKVAEYAKSRDAKIAGEGITGVQSTKDFLMNFGKNGTSTQQKTTKDEAAQVDIPPDSKYAELEGKIKSLEDMLVERSKAPKYVRPDYSGEINQSYDNLLDSQKAKLREDLRQKLSRFGGLKQQAGQQATSSLNANDATMLQNLQRLYNSNEAAGQYGDSGANVSGKIQLGAVQGQNANAIRQDRDNYLNSLDTEANTLQSTAADNELAITGEIEAQRLKDLQAARQWADSMDMQNTQFQYGVSKDEQDRLDKLAQLNTQNEQWDKTFEAEQKWKDYEANQAKANQEWARSEANPAYRAQILANQISELELMNLPEVQRLQIQQLKRQIAQIGAVQPMSDYEKQMQNIKLDTARAELDKIRNPQPKAQTWQDFYDIGLGMKGKYYPADPVNGTQAGYQGGQTDNQIRQWIAGLPISDDEVVQLSKALGVYLGPASMGDFKKFN